MNSVIHVFSDLPTYLPEELYTPLLQTSALRIEKIVSRGHVTPAGTWFDQDQHEWVMLLQGAATLRFEDDETLTELRPGDAINIPAHRRHRVEWTTPDEPTLWLAVHYHGDARD
ncbi:MAG: cupin domain-containing protein [Planctomycetaceae bacterium]